MGRRRRSSGLDALTKMPWPVGATVGIGAFCAIRYAVPWWLSRQEGPLAQGLAGHFWQALAPFAWLILVMCWLAALLSYLGARRRRILLDTCSTLDRLAAPGWCQFELLVGEAFRRQGYAVEETGLGGADGGVDLILRKGGRRILVQCKQWKRQQVGVNVVREMAGLQAHHGADEVKIVCIGTFTRDAEAFARGKRIELISGETLLEMIRATKTPLGMKQKHPPRIEPKLAMPPETTTSARTCPRCGSAMVQRTNRRTREHFLGCAQFPICRGSAR